MRGLYQFLLSLYPRPYRLAYADLMQGIVLEQLAEANTPLQQLLIWVQAVADLLRCLPAEHISMHNKRQVSINRYTLLQPLAEQTGHSTFLGRDIRSGRMVVMTLQHPLPQETNLYAALNSNMVKVFARLQGYAEGKFPRLLDQFEEKKQVFVHEFLDGKSLQWYVGRPLTVSRVVSWAIDICDQLDYLHHQQPPIVVRDIKPKNILIRPNDSAVLIDFGIARPLPGDWKPSETDKIGTEGFSPPEQYDGWAAPTSDIYSLGATLHYLLTGLDPRQRDPFTFAHYPIDSPLGKVIAKATALDPGDRYRSAAEFKDALTLCMSIG